jgi:O-acetyl-ADP-ribose deacetylase (regulator of RNase III)
VQLEAEARQAHSVAFPALGTGVGEVPMELAAALTFEAFRTFAALNPRNVRELLVYLYDDDALARWKTTLAAM